MSAKASSFSVSTLLFLPFGDDKSDSLASIRGVGIQVGPSRVASMRERHHFTTSALSARCTPEQTPDTENITVLKKSAF